MGYWCEIFNRPILGLLPTEWVDLREKLSDRLAKEEVGGFLPGEKWPKFLEASR